MLGVQSIDNIQLTRRDRKHTLLNLRGSIPEFILVTEGKYHDSYGLDVIVPQLGGIYQMDKACVDLEVFYRIQMQDAYFYSKDRISIEKPIKKTGFQQ